ncbi:MAG: methylenetetrahydrofolate reductase [Dehalococcoidia bacterium]
MDLDSSVPHTDTMTFAAALTARCFPVTLEITPPQRPLPTVLLRRAGLLGPCTPTINMIQRPSRQSSLDASLHLRGEGFNPVWHLVNRGRTRAAIAADLARARDGGITQVLCIRGDHAGADTSDTPPIREVTGMVRDGLPAALIGVTLNQSAPDRAAVLRNLLPKLAAGAGYVQTQPTFDLDTLRPFVETLRDHAPDTRIVPMVMPLLSIEAVRAIQTRLGIALPASLCRRIEQGGTTAAWQAFEETVVALRQSKLADGLAIMTFEMDPVPETGHRIITTLRAAGLTIDPPVGEETISSG